jgi:anti-sigma-K factor RskA
VSGTHEMPTGRDCGLDAAAYLLGALEPDEARAYSHHLARCAVCRDEVAALGSVLAALPSAAPARPAPRAVRRRVLRAVRAQPKAAGRRPRRIRLVAPPARAAWLAFGLAVVAALLVQVGATRPHVRVIPAAVGLAQLRVARGHGELHVDRLPPLASDQTYELWVVTPGRSPKASTLFGVSSRGRADVGVPGDLQGVTRLLVTVEPRRGSVVPTGRPVIVELLT